jgi:CRP-like cAMP-binding protein
MSRHGEIFERKAIPAGKMVMREGDEGHCAYLVQSGRVLVFTEKDGKTIELARLEAGEIFGEMALVCDEPRAASVKTLVDTTVIVIMREAFEEKLERSDPTIRAVVKMLSQRMLEANKAVARQKTDT